MTLSLAVFVSSLVIAWWQYRKAHRAMINLNASLEEFPARVAAALLALNESNHSDASGDPTARLSRVDYEDVNADGEKELLFQHPVGAHGSVLKIFKWETNGFRELARLGAGTPVGFEYGDFDGDGKVEIKTEETDSSAGLPYVSSPRVALLMRWNGSEFVEVSRKVAVV